MMIGCTGPVRRLPSAVSGCKIAARDHTGPLGLRNMAACQIDHAEGLHPQIAVAPLGPYGTRFRKERGAKLENAQACTELACMHACCAENGKDSSGGQHCLTNLDPQDAKIEHFKRRGPIILKLSRSEAAKNALAGSAVLVQWLRNKGISETEGSI